MKIAPRCASFACILAMFAAGGFGGGGGTITAAARQDALIPCNAQIQDCTGAVKGFEGQQIVFSSRRPGGGCAPRCAPACSAGCTSGAVPASAGAAAPSVASSNATATTATTATTAIVELATTTTTTTTAMTPTGQSVPSRNVVVGVVDVVVAVVVVMLVVVVVEAQVGVDVGRVETTDPKLTLGLCSGTYVRACLSAWVRVRACAGRVGVCVITCKQASERTSKCVRASACVRALSLIHI